MRIAILEPYIAGIGGAQRVIGKYADYLQSKGHYVEIFTQKYDKETAYEGFKKIKINILKPYSKMFSPFVFLFKKIKGFDVFVLNDFPSNFASFRNKPSLWICYSPRRYFYDLKEYYLKNASFSGKIILLLKILFFKKIDFLSAQSTKKIVAISETVRKRIKDYYKRESEIIYPGIEIKEYKNKNYEDYFLCVSRFVKPKRVDVVIESMKFVKNKKIKLYVAGDGPDKEEIESLCKKHPNVKFLGCLNEKKLIELYSNCFGVVYIPLNEDFGLIPLEAAASGKPIIGANEGGLKETIVNEKTGFLLDSINPKSIAEKIDFLYRNKKIAMKMGKEARENIKKFDWEFLMPRLEKEIKSLV